MRQSKGKRLAWVEKGPSFNLSVTLLDGAHLYQPRAAVVKKTKCLKPLVEGHKVAFGGSHDDGQPDGL